MLLGGVLAVIGDSAAVGQRLAGDYAQLRGLAAARRPQQRHQFAGGNVEDDVVEGIELPEALFDVADFDALDVHQWAARRSRRVCHSIIVFKNRVPRASSASSEAPAKAATKMYSLKSTSTCSGMVVGRPRMWPDTTDTAPNSPMARALHRITPYSSPHFTLGRVTCQKVCQSLAPSATAASSSSLPCSSMSGISSRATKGNVTKSVASTKPGTAKMSLMSCACSQGPSQPCRPNSST